MDEDKQTEGKKRRNSRTVTKLYRSKRRRPSTIVDGPPGRLPVHLLRGASPPRGISSAAARMAVVVTSPWRSSVQTCPRAVPRRQRAVEGSHVIAPGASGAAGG
jgi:hypothetical protein